MKAKSKVLISVLNWNNAADTIKCVHSLKNLNYADFTIVVADNNSLDNSVDLIQKEFPEILIILSKENLGYAGGNKLAYNWGKDKGFELFWIINNDSIADENCLSHLVDAYLKNGNNYIYGGITLEPDKETISYGSGFDFDENHKINFKIYNPHGGKKITEEFRNNDIQLTGDVNGANMLIPFEVISKYGFIDDSFFLYGEELDYCFTLREKYNIQSCLVPHAIVFHNASASFKKSDSLALIAAYYRLRNWHFFEMRHMKKSKLQLIRSEYSLAIFIITLLKRIISDRKTFLENQDSIKKLAFTDAILGIKGKVFEPNDFLN